MRVWIVIVVTNFGTTLDGVYATKKAAVSRMDIIEKLGKRVSKMDSEFIYTVAEIHERVVGE